MGIHASVAGRQLAEGRPNMQLLTSPDALPEGMSHAQQLRASPLHTRSLLYAPPPPPSLPPVLLAACLSRCSPQEDSLSAGRLAAKG